ncbi:hypothetical protein OUZ56_029329 [Daphnia magna]|uniref:Uncharacterized protein n=1 Tax=Daphnia magna TaxID=35525 RepID=A0ABR0B6I0_9CRUS|nr:hypothetical protein OUZ56_029329 [Daphnia magna]
MVFTSSASLLTKLCGALFLSRREERFAFTRDNNSCYEDRDVGRNEKQFYSFQSVPDVLSLKPSSLTEREEELSRGFHQYKRPEDPNNLDNCSIENTPPIQTAFPVAKQNLVLMVVHP